MSIEGHRQGHFLTLFFLQVLYILCLYEAQISGERLQDHWSSGLFQFLFQGLKFVVLNTDESDGKGLYWVAVFVPYPGPLEFFDPLGESPETYKNYFKYWLESNGRSYMRNERICRSYGTTTCGEFCVYY